MLKVKFSQGPTNAEKVIRQALVDINKDKNTATPFRSIDPNTVQIGAHHPVYDVALDDIKAGRFSLEGSNSVSRCLLSEGLNVVASAEVDCAQDDSLTAFRMLNEGPFVKGFENAVRSAEKLKKEGEYSCAVVRIASMYVMALLLQPEGEGESIILPISPAPSYLDKPEYSEKEFLAELKPHVDGSTMPA
ncbi:hypothetical protein ACMXYN_07670 [Neptuniibacter sp. PT8_73]|uniref:hypothetical protein n=1 Tax=unclassified Neptuniibacter TaxID=2630693 RepID=UPI0039F585D9